MKTSKSVQKSHSFCLFNHHEWSSLKMSQFDMFFCIGAFKQNKQGVAVNRGKMALLTNIGRHCFTFSGRPLALPASENICTRLGFSLAQTLHTSILGSGPEGVRGPKVWTEWILSNGTPGDAAIPTLLGVTQKLTAFFYVDFILWIRVHQISSLKWIKEIDFKCGVTVNLKSI